MTESFTLQNIKDFKVKLLNCLRPENVFCILDTNDFYEGKDLASKPYYHTYDYIVAMGAKAILKCSAGYAFEKLKAFKNEHQNEWIFGYFGYDLKNEIEVLESDNTDHLDFEDMFFFVPENVLLIKENQLIIHSGTNSKLNELLNIINNEQTKHKLSNTNLIEFKNRIAKAYYLETVEKLRNHIIEGDVYEVSYCQEFYAENADIDPFQTFEKLSQISPQPFSSFMRIEDKYILSASMERYLKKEGNKLISQPIKGTIRRGKDAEEDEFMKNALLNDEKERAENVMIVDLVRNDLSRTCIPGSVKVEELFGIYEFPGVYQMISTVVGELLPDKAGLDAIKGSFPMGSMTGAPKVMAMEIIEQYEQSKRGIYSGALGYFAPNGDFDFNVVIRTLLYNASKKNLSLHVGSAITYDSVPDREYEECLVKIRGILKLFEDVGI